MVLSQEVLTQKPSTVLTYGFNLFASILPNIRGYTMKLKTTLSPKQPPKKKSTSQKVVQWQPLLSQRNFDDYVSLLSYNATDVSAIFDTTDPKARKLLGSFGAHIAAVLLYFFGCSVWINHSYSPIVYAVCSMSLRG